MMTKHAATNKGEIQPSRSLQDTKEMFLRKAIEKILSERDIKKTYNSQLKKACEVSLEELNAEVGPNNKSSTNVVPSQSNYVQADKYFLPFELACQSKSAKICVIALDCLQKLIAYGHLTGRAADNVNPKRLLIDRVVDAICICFIGPSTDEGVQLQIIKALMTVVSSQKCEVHEASLLHAIKTVYNIYLASKNLVNQTTAKAILMQMINIVFTRMEAQADGLDELEDPTGSGQMLITAMDYDVRLVMEDLLCEVTMRHDQGGAEECQFPVSGDKSAAGDELSLHPSENGYSDDPFGVATKVSPVPGGGNTPDRQMNSPSRQAPQSAKGISPTESFDAGSSPQLSFGHVLQKDAFLIFRALCRLSQKALPDTVDPKSHELRSKILSLQLLYSIVQKPGFVLKNHHVFISGIKQYLCVALSKNGVSSVGEVFELSLAIFLALLANFKSHLKTQVEVFFREIFLNILESSSTSFEQKWMVMQALGRICSDAQSVVDIYVNYDCDISSSNIFERLVNDISKVAQGRQMADLGATPTQERSMRLKGLECLVMILKCMVEWSKDLYVSPANLATESTESRRPAANSSESSSSNGVGSTTHDGVTDTTTNSTSATTSTISTSDSVHQFEQQKQIKAVYEQGIDIFNRKPKQGIKFLQDNNLVGVGHEEIAKLMFNEDRLDKTVVGDFLGDGEAFCKEIMYSYVDQLQFKDIKFLPALRLFLDNFRLPGEAQKIDRLMEKFASRYFETNPKHDPPFASADTAYVLAYSIIMLTTDLHSSRVRHKMTNEQYIKMNRGINDSEDLPEAYLSAIYAEIAADEIKMKLPQVPVKQTTVSTSEKQKRLLFNLEMESMAQTAKALMEAASHVQNPFTSATHSEHVRPMFKSAWTPCLAAFSVGLQNTNDDEVVNLCLEGFRCAIRIACIFHLELERDAYMQALARFTLLTANSYLTEMKSKNIDTIKTLITVAHTDGNYLGKGWLEIIKCISQLELAQLIGTGVNPKFISSSISGAGGSSTKTPAGSVASLHSSFLDSSSSDSKRTAGLKESLGETSSMSVVVAVDRIFTGSVCLDGQAIVDFVRALCQVSLEELSNPVHPRMFCLQKIVEISYYNMGRIRLQWSRIWQVLGEHFNRVGCNANEEVAFKAVDSLRQLSTKFLERGELKNFRFQKDFLRPFEYIMKRNQNVMIRDMVVRCMTNMVWSQNGKLRSGWKNIFLVFQMAASDGDDSIVELAFSTTSELVQGKKKEANGGGGSENAIFELHFDTIIDSFQEAVKCLSEFACYPHNPDMSMEAIGLIRRCARYVDEKQNMFAEHAWEDSSNIAESERVWMRGWFPIMFAMSSIVSRCKLDVRTRGLTEMFGIMKTYGHQFKSHWWKELFLVAFRIFGIMQLPEQQTEKAEWLMTTCNHALFSIVDVFSQFYEQLHTVVLPDLYRQIDWCVEQDNEQLAKNGVECLGNIVTTNGSKFTAELWEETVKLLLRIFEKSLPYDLQSWSPGDDLQRLATLEPGSLQQSNTSDVVSRVSDGSPEMSQDTTPRESPKPNAKYGGLPVQEQLKQFSVLQIRCVVQLELIHTIDAVLFGPGVSRREDERLVAEARQLAGEPEPIPTRNSRTSSVMSLASGRGRMTSTDVDSMTPDTHRDIVSVVQEEQFGLYHCLTVGQRFAIVEHCLLKSHDFARAFNENQAQRNLLWKAGFKEKPNLLSQERSSLTCALRLLYRMLADSSMPAENVLAAQKILCECVARSLQYYVAEVKSDSHRESWTPVLILILSRSIRSLSDEQFHLHATQHHKLILKLFSTQAPGTGQVKALAAKYCERFIDLLLKKTNTML